MRPLSVGKSYAAFLEIDKLKVGDTGLHVDELKKTSRE